MKSNFGAQVSVVEYDSDSHDLRTVSLHVFEDEAMRSGYYHNHSAPFVRVDPENRDGIQCCCHEYSGKWLQ